MDQLQFIDWLVIAIFLVLTFGIGIWTSLGIKKSSDFFLSGRKLGPALQFFINFGQMTDSSGAPLVATAVYEQGAAGMWISFQTLFLTPIYWFSSIWFRRTRLVTAADLFIDRFNSIRLARTFAWYFVFLVPLYLALGNIVSYKVAASLFTKSPSAYTEQEKGIVQEFDEYELLKQQVVAAKLPLEKRARFDELNDRVKTGEITSYISYIKPIPFYFFYSLFVAAYIMLGGIKAAAMADAVQGILIVILSAVLIPFGLTRVGGFHGLHGILPDFMFRLFGSDHAGAYTWYSILFIVLNGVVSLPSPTWITNNAAARNETSLRVGMLGGGFCKRIVMIMWMFCGLLAFALFSHRLSDPDQAWGVLSGSLLGPGLLGLMISGMLLGHMPLVGVAAVNFSATFTRNIFQPLFPQASPALCLKVAQLSVIGVLVAGVLVSLMFSGVLELVNTILTFITFVGAVTWLIYFWRKLTALAVALGMVLWFLLIVVLPWTLPLISSFRTNPEIVLQTVPGGTNQVPLALFFDQVVHVDPLNDASLVQGLGRFHIENYFFYKLGLPLQHFNSAGLFASRYAFSIIVPFIILIGLSYLTPRRRFLKNTAPSAKLSAMEIRKTIQELVDGSRAIQVNSAETPEEEQLRIKRFYAKMNTPIGGTDEEEVENLYQSYIHPDRYAHLKIFPHSNWEINYWPRQDIIGFGLSCLGVVLILLLLFFLLNLGA